MLSKSEAMFIGLLQRVVDWDLTIGIADKL